MLLRIDLKEAFRTVYCCIVLLQQRELVEPRSCRQSFARFNHSHSHVPRRKSPLLCLWCGALMSVNVKFMPFC